MHSKHKSQLTNYGIKITRKPNKEIQDRKTQNKEIQNKETQDTILCQKIENQTHRKIQKIPIIPQRKEIQQKTSFNLTGIKCNKNNVSSHIYTYQMEHQVEETESQYHTYSLINFYFYFFMRQNIIECPKEQSNINYKPVRLPMLSFNIRIRKHPHITRISSKDQQPQKYFWERINTQNILEETAKICPTVTVTLRYYTFQISFPQLFLPSQISYYFSLKKTSSE